MSALTKVFVVLHVVLTMLFVSAAIVFVNRVENFKGTASKQNDALKIEQRRAEFAINEAQVAKADATAVKQQSATELTRIRTQYNTALGDLREKDAQLAAAKQDLLSAQASLQAATGALATAQDSNKLLTAQISETRTAGDKTQQQNTELLTANSTLNSKLQTAIRQLRNAQEDIDALQTEVARLQDTGGAPADGAQAGAGGAARGGSAAGGPRGERPGITPAVAINGVIRDRRNVNGVPYATISVGSQDQVTADMVFNVIERGDNGDFLGYLRIDRVEPNEAVGRLEGPRINDVKPGNEVRTQL